MVVVRECGVEDAVRLWSLIPEFAESRDSASQKCAERMAGRQRVFFEALDAGEPAGFAIAYDRDADGSFYAWMIGVLPNHRRRGCLKALALAVEDWARAHGYPLLRIKTRNERREMLSFLVANGFNFVSVEAREDVRDNRILLEKEL